MSFKPGQYICHDKYEILAPIGEGTFARVWQAREPDFANRHVAIKELKREDLTPEELRESEQRFQREIRLAHALQEGKVPNVVQAFAVERLPETGDLLLVMQYMPGGSLEERIKSRPHGLDVLTAQDIALDLCAALAAFHQLPLLPVHRDIKPSNILFSGRDNANSTAHLADFGLAQLPGESERSYGTGRRHPGTPLYMPPEQDRGQASLRPSADIYALGCMCFEMLTGKPYGRQPMGTLPGQLRAGLPVELDAIMARAVAEEAGDRYHTASEFGAGLRELRDSLAAEQRRRERIDVLRGQADAATAAGNWAAARQSLRQWQDLSPRDPELDAARLRLQQAEAEAQRRTQIARSEQQTRATSVADNREQWLERNNPAVIPTSGSAEAVQTTQPSVQGQPAISGARVLLIIVLGVAAVVLLCAAAVRFSGELSSLLAGEEGSSTPDVQAGQTPEATITAGATRTPSPTNSPTVAATAEPTPDGPPEIAVLGDTWLRPTDGMTMMYVPAGSFMMGSAAGDTEADSDEFPQHEVALDGFWIDRTEVTNGQYERCVADGDCPTSFYAEDAGWNEADYPVVGVSWFNAEAYCTWAGGRMPTEAEWEYAARGPEGKLYPWGDEAPTCQLAKYSPCTGDTIPVGSRPAGASWVGALGMAGNVWEWVQDWYASYDDSPSNNPTGPSEGAYKVLRGGNWNLTSRGVRSANRGPVQPELRYRTFGFRCALPQAVDSQ